jgi:hypothetical protein
MNSHLHIALAQERIADLHRNAAAAHLTARQMPRKHARRAWLSVLLRQVDRSEWS